MSRWIRWLGGALIAAGVCSVAWALVVWQWQDPFTAVYTAWEQRKLSSSYEKRAESYRPLVRSAKARSAASTRVLVEREAKRYRATLEGGSALGRLKIPRLGLSVVLVTGTDSESLKRGPGWYTGSYLPGQGELIYIAGHRTTYSAPFSRIDDLRPGDQVRIEVPYATFLYRVRMHKIVPGDDISRLVSHGREVVALQACHPRFFATHRYIVYAYPVRVVPRNGPAYPVAQSRLAAGT
jgi:sortase A